MICTDPLQAATLVLGNFAANGVIGTAAATVDVASAIAVAQTTDGVQVTIPIPTAGAAAAGQMLMIMNTGTATLWVAASATSPVPALVPTAHTKLMFDGTNWSQMVGAQSGKFAFASPTGSLTLTALHYMVNCNNGATAVTITLPAAASNGGRAYIIKRFSGSTGTVTINSTGGNVQSTAGTFAATTTLAALGTYGQHQQFMSDGSVWNRIN
jgi:hypothetical protein